MLAVALCIAAPPAAVAAQPAAIELLAAATGFPAAVLRSQAADVLILLCAVWQHLDMMPCMQCFTYMAGSMVELQVAMLA